MTSAEIKENIRYNENLVSSYQSSVRKLQSQISELQRLKAKFGTLQNNLGNKQLRRRNNLANLSSKKIRLKMVSKYKLGMKLLLAGTEYRNTYNGIYEAQSRIDSKILSIQNEINSYSSKISYRRGRVSYWRNQLLYADKL